MPVNCAFSLKNFIAKPFGTLFAYYIVLTRIRKAFLYLSSKFLSLPKEIAMGTQQMLMIVLSVIIVGIAAAIGITMFINQGYNANKEALASEMVTYPPTILRFWRSSKLLGGAGGDVNEVSTSRVANYLGWTGPNFSQTSDNGEYRLIGATGTRVVLRAQGVERRGSKHPIVTTRINLSNGSVVTALSDSTAW
jgi:hypothetical protein